MLFKLFRTLQKVLYTLTCLPILGAFFKRAYWDYFWWFEYLQERAALGQENSIPIKGSERAVLIETLIGEYQEHSGPMLEVGMGYGQNLVVLSTMMPQDHLTGIDMSEDRVQETGRLFSENGYESITIEPGNVLNLQYEDNSFKTVFSSAVFLYLSAEEAIQAVGEMARVASQSLVFLEQHHSELSDLKLPRGVDGGSYYLRDYNALFKACDLTDVEELEVPNPRWGVEKWGETARVFKVPTV